MGTDSHASHLSEPALQKALRDEFLEIRAALSRSDQKAGTLLGIVGVALALTLTVLTTAKTRSMSSIALLAFGGGCVGAMTLAAAAFLLVIAVRPVTHLPGSWNRLASKMAEEIVQTLEDESSELRNNRIATSVSHLAKRAMHKIKCVQISTDLMLAALLILTFSAVLFAITT